MDLFNRRERRERREEEAEETALANCFKWEILSFFSAPSAPSVVKKNLVHKSADNCHNENRIS
jgi:hypothetical protein